MLSVAGGIVLGLLVGSFLNVVIYRVPLMMEREWRAQCREISGAGPDPQQDDEAPFNLLKPASHCPACNTPIKAIHNVPVFGWLFLGGKCAACKAKISPRYPVIELLTGLLSGLIVWQFGAGLTGGATLLFLWALIALTMIDIDHQLLPDNITYPVLWLGLIVSVTPATAGTIPSPDLGSSVIGAAAGYLSLWSVYWLFKILTGKEGMGYGDFKLLAALGAWLGWQLLPLVILLSAVVGATVGIGMILILGRDKQVPIPFGPYLAGAGLIALLWGRELTDFYLRYSGVIPE